MSQKGMCLGLALGAGLMYLFDPQSGRRRRALARDRCARVLNRSQVRLQKAWRDARHRATGIWAELRGALARPDIPDDVLQNRIRSKLGRYVTRARAINVNVHDGRVTLSGSIPPDDAPELVHAVERVPGVHSVVNRLASGDQTRFRSGYERWNIREPNWAPGTRLVVGVSGALLLAYALARRSSIACATGTVAAGLCASAAARRGYAPRS
jgi:hypothetical protein